MPESNELSWHRHRRSMEMIPTCPRSKAASDSTLSPYALSKAVCEEYCRLFYQLYGLETVCLRYFNVFGPRQDPKSEYAAVIPRFTTRILA